MDDVQAIKLGEAEPHAPITLSGVDRVGERLGRHIRSQLEPMLGAKPTVVAKGADTINFDLWSAMAPTFAALSVHRLSGLKANVLLKMDSMMVTAIVERYFGGSAGKPAAERNEFTYSEERILAKLSDAIMVSLGKAWREVVDMEASLVSRETDPQSLTFAETNDQMLVQAFDISIGRDDPWTVELLYPIVALRQIEPLLSGTAVADSRMTDPLWRSRLAQQMQEIRLPARTVLARPSLNLQDLLALKAGDVIPVNIARNLPLIVGTQVVAHGTIGEQNGHAAFRIEKMN
jgi:flagellar motor switch protein FliM